MVNHACNLRCTYCYTGAKFNRPMALKIGAAAIDRAFRSLATGGRLDLGFFGGEPLIEAGRILEWMDHARNRSQNGGQGIGFSLTTNGTISNAEAQEVMLAEDLDLTVSFDGSPKLHDRHRQDHQGRGSSALVLDTLRWLQERGKAVRVNVVVRPDALDELEEGLVFLHELGIRQVDLSLDLWTHWNFDDGRRLEKFIRAAAVRWRDWLPDFSINWFDAKVRDLAQVPILREVMTCGFGAGEIAVAPSGRLYPCERLIGEDRLGQPLQLPGDALEGEDFTDYSAKTFQSCSACSQCALAGACDTKCRCSNFVRTGNVDKPDGLLCRLNTACARAVGEVLAESKFMNEGATYA